MRPLVGLAFLLVTGCADGIAPWAPPVVVTYALRPGERIACEETMVRLGLPNGLLQVLGWARRRWTCELITIPPVVRISRRLMQEE